MSPSTLPASAYEALELPAETVKILTNPKPDNSPAAAASPNLLQNAQTPEQTLAANDTFITLYAELLLHIRTITLFASLRTLHTRETKAKLSTDGCSITVTHEGQSATVRLPIKVEGGGDAALSLPAQPPSKELTLRLQIEEKDGTNMLGALQAEERKANIVPWDGTSLNDLNEADINCKNCENVVVPRGSVSQWRDLPNENWAEMMDFWHCHKPDEHHLHDHTHHEIVGKKGYAAGNKLKAAEGVGFVDLASFLLKEQDFASVEVGFLFPLAKLPFRAHHSNFSFLKSVSGCKEGDLSLSSWHRRRYNRPRLRSSTHLTRNTAANPLPLEDGLASIVGERHVVSLLFRPQASGNGRIRLRLHSSQGLCLAHLARFHSKISNIDIR